MAATLQCLLAIIILGFICHEVCEASCRDRTDLSNIQISQNKTGKIVKGKPEYLVTVSTNCATCTRVDVKLKCPNFQTVEPIDPSILTVEADVCSLQDYIYSDTPATFKYAWDTPFAITLKASNVVCSD